MTAEIVQFDTYLRRKRATDKALADEAQAEAALPAQPWETLEQLLRKRDQPKPDGRTWEQVHKSLENLALKLAIYQGRLGPSRLNE